MLIHPQFDPVAVQLGPVAVHWYGIMYLVGFALFLILGRRRAEDAWRGMTKADLEDLLFYGVLGVVLGGRLGFCLFYQPAWFTSHPLDVFKVWQGGMSAHGGMIGCIIAMLVFARTRGKSFWTVSDFTAPLVPLGLLRAVSVTLLTENSGGERLCRICPGPCSFRRPGTISRAILRSFTKRGLRGSVFCAALVGVGQKPRPRVCFGAFLHRLRCCPLFCRVLPGTGQLSRFGVTRTFARPVAVTAAHFDRHRRFDLGLASLAP